MAKQPASAPREAPVGESSLVAAPDPVPDKIISLPEMARQLRLSPALVFGLLNTGLLLTTKGPSGLKGVSVNRVNRLLDASDFAPERRVK